VVTVWTLILIVAPIAGAVIAARRGAKAVAVMLGLVALLPLWGVVALLGLPALLMGATLAGVLVWHRWSRSAATVTRWGARSRRKSGVASTLDVVRFAGGWAMLRKAGQVRPSLDGLSRRALIRSVRVSEVAVRLCRAGLVSVWSSVEDVVVTVGGPRVGKSGWLAGQIIDAPGAVLVTSTRLDLHDLTAPYRERSGPVLVFNAVGLGEKPSTITFDPLTGCGDPVTAAERAADMLSAISSGGGGDREYWELQGRRVLEALLHAAALGHCSMREVLGWVANPEASRKEVTGLLRRSPEPAFGVSFEQFVTTNDRTRTSITSTIMPTMGWLTSAPAREAAGLGPEGARPFDVAQLLDSKATVFLLGGEESQAAPLVCALTGYIAREARRIATTKPGGRLDPPLRLALDEAALICPVPLESWTADMGGRGVTILCVVQSRAQLLARYGEHGAATILNNAGAVMVFGGTRDKQDLEFWSTLTGDRDEAAETTDLHGRTRSRTSRKTAVLSPAQIANLPAGKVLVIRRGISPVVGRAQMVWKRPDLRWTAFSRRRPGLARRIAALVGSTPGVRSWVALLVPGWPGPVLAPAASRGALDEGLVIEGQVYDTDQASGVEQAGAAEEQTPAEAEQPVTMERSTS
jgi:type IV secretion system protein VirD4